MQVNQERCDQYQKEGLNPRDGDLNHVIQIPINMGILFGMREQIPEDPDSFSARQSIGQPDPFYIDHIQSISAAHIPFRQCNGQSHNLSENVVHCFNPLVIADICGNFLGRDEPHADWSAVLYGPGR